MAIRKQNQFLSKGIYDSLIEKNNFWRLLRDQIDWSELSEPLKDLHKNSLEGNKNWPVEMKLKMLILQRVYNTSERKTEELCTQTIPVKFFLGLEINGKSPDHTVLTNFRNTILKTKGIEFYEALFEKILKQLEELGINFTGTYSVDSTITEAQSHGKGKDTEAKWVKKKKEIKKEDGTKTIKEVNFYGYKTHASVHTETELITSMEHTPANRPDGEQFQPLIQNDIDKGRKVEAATADKAYDEFYTIYWLEKVLKIVSGILIKKNRKGSYWEEYRKDTDRRNAMKKRPIVEREFADMKNNHGLKYCIYKGITKYKLQSYLSGIAHNLKTAFRQLYGARLHLV